MHTLMRTRMRTPMRTRTATLLLATVLPLATACVSAEEKARRDEEAMVALAREDAEAESLFVHDSLALTASFTVDTVFDLQQTVALVDRDGDTITPVRYLARTARGADCLLDSAHFVRVVRGDTLRCQWTPHDSQP